MRMKTLALSVALIQQERHKQGYAPQPPAPALKTWRAPDLSEQEQQERKRMIDEKILPF